MSTPKDKPTHVLQLIRNPSYTSLQRCQPPVFRTTYNKRRAFYPFSRLPTELQLQLQIWQLAAGTFDYLGSSYMFQLCDLSILSPSLQEAYYIPPKHKWWRSHEIQLATMRISVLHTCRLARIVALEAWKKDLEGIDRQAAKVNGRPWRDCSEKLDIVEGLIGKRNEVGC